MTMKQLLSLAFLSFSFVVHTQGDVRINFGHITQNDADITHYKNDSTANALFLFERGKTDFIIGVNRVIIRTKYYAKIKLFNKNGFKHATVKIPVYRNKNAFERVEDIEAVTHNGTVKTYLKKDRIFKDEINEHWSEVKFTMPAVKENSIIEYQYTLESPFKFNFAGWEFQGEIPKLHSEFKAEIPGNYVYNRRLNGFLQLSKNDADIKKNCFSIPGYSGTADCEVLTYAMEHIPAFTPEDYMTSKKDYLSAIKFELAEFRGFDGMNEKYTKTWKDVDKEFKTDKHIGRQLKKDKLLKKQLPPELLAKTTLENAKAIYRYIKNNINYNGKIRLFTEVDVEKALTDKVGNSTEINIALINALRLAGFDVELLLVSTRDNGRPTKLYPVLSDFNYAIAKLNLADKTYLLDATQKAIPFGMLPFKTLNGYGRAMNFDKGSYWYDIVPVKNNGKTTLASLTLTEEGNLQGMMRNSYTGYKAANQRIRISEKGEQQYLNDLENKDDRLRIAEYKLVNFEEPGKRLTENLKITIESDLDGDILRINPFFRSKIGTNPFKLAERTYPIDFGYAQTDNYALNFNVPPEFKITELPENMAIKLPDDGGSYIFMAKNNGNSVQISSKLTLNKTAFPPVVYPYLKEFYKQIIKNQQSYITLEKIK